MLLHESNLCGAHTKKQVVMKLILHKLERRRIYEIGQKTYNLIQRMNRKIINSIILFYLFLSINVSAQIPVADSYLLSPNAASLGQYGEVPVSLYTGTVQINVPIYEIDYMGHKIPISMTYHGSGVRPDQHPGWVGLGWNLNAGGCISRIVNGLPDETYREWRSIETEKAMGYFFTTQGAQDVVPPKPQEFSSANNYDALYNFYYQADYNPDEFIFNFLGISGSFFMSPDGSWVVKSKHNIKVEFEMLNKENYFSEFNRPFGLHHEDYMLFKNNFSPTIKGFKIIGVDGTEYVFGIDINAVEFSVGFFSQLSESIAATTWHLKSIKYTNGAIIDFDYSKRDWIAQLTIASYKMDVYGPELSLHLPPTKAERYAGSLISPSYISQIKFGNNKVNFNISETKELRYEFVPMISHNFDSNTNQYSKMPYLQCYQANGQYLSESVHLNYESSLQEHLKWYKLIGIYVTNGNGKIVKNVLLNYNDENTSTQYSQRLALMSITDVNTGGKYQFDYNDIAGLPCYCSGQTDHWGFFNGVEDLTFGDNVFMKPYFYHAKRSVASAMKKGLLTKVIYPTGGYNRFEYEANDYAERVEFESNLLTSYDVDQIAGGVKIKKIYNSDTGAIEDEFIAKTFYYVHNINDTKSSGILMRYPKYKEEGFQIVANNGKTYVMNVYSSQSVLPMSSNSSGIHIGYSTVIEELADGSYTIHKFSNYKTNPDSPSTLEYKNNSFYRPNISMEQERGLLLNRKEYDSSGALKKKISYNYQKNSENYPELHCKNHKVCMLKEPYAFIEESWTTRLLYEMLPKKEVVTTYEQGGDSIVNTTTYSYNSHGLVSKVVKTLNHGESEQTLIKYPTDFPDSTVYANFQERHILSPVVEQIIQRVDSVGNTSTVSRLFNHYSSDNPVFPYAVDMAIGNNPYENRHKYRFGEYLNPVAEIKDNGNETVYIWGYNHQYIVAVIEGSYYNEVCGIFGTPNSFATSLTPDFTKLYDFRDRFVSRSRVTIYEYDPLVGVTKKILPDGSSISYHYDSAGRLSHTTDSEGKVIEVYDYNFR